MLSWEVPEESGLVKQQAVILRIESFSGASVASDTSPAFSDCLWSADLGGEIVLMSLQVDLAFNLLTQGGPQAVVYIFVCTLECS